MEEIVSAEVIKGEILDDARAKAARLLEEAEAEGERIIDAIEVKARSVVEEIIRDGEAGAARFRMETMARLPLEKTRLRSTFVENALRERLRSFLDALSEDRVAGLAESMLRGGASFLAGKEIAIGRKGISEAVARAAASRAFPGASDLAISEEPSIPARGLVARTVDGSVILEATLDLIEEKLLDQSRSELAKALCSEALKL